MSDSVLATKLYPPSRSPGVVSRGRLLERLDRGLSGAVTLVSAPAGFGKTTLVVDWLTAVEAPTAWLSLEERDNNLTTFLTGLVAALQRISPGLGDGTLSLLRSPHTATIETLLTPLVNEISSLSEFSILVLDDYHTLDDRRLTESMVFLVEHLPQQLHLALLTREDPPLPLARLRARGQLTEVRARELRFTPTEATAFFKTMGLDLKEKEVEALESRTEGWIAGLQLAALSLQEEEDQGDFVRSFSGSHRFVLDYLVEEVLDRRTPEIQRFLLESSILYRLSGPLCDAVLDLPPGTGQRTLEVLERSNLFLVPLDGERRWYRYHHLFGDLLRQRLQQSDNPGAGPEVPGPREAELHRQASLWHEKNGLDIDAFRHAARAVDTERTFRLAQGDGTPLHHRGGGASVLAWLEGLPRTLLDEKPELWVLWASALSSMARKEEVKEKLASAEAALTQRAEPLAAARDRREPGEFPEDLRGQIAAIRAMEAAGEYDIEAVITESREALRLLAPQSLAARTAATWALGFAHQIEGDSEAARRRYTEAVSLSRATDNEFMEILAATGLGIIQEEANELTDAETTFRGAVGLVRDRTEPALCEAHLGLARIAYERNDLEVASSEARTGYDLALKIPVVDTYVACLVLFARIALAKGELHRAEEHLQNARDEATVRGFVEQLPAIEDVEVRLLAQQGSAQGATERARSLGLPEPLSSRELEIIRLVAKGHSNQEIGERLFISLSTVKGHNQNIFGKLGVQRRTEAVARCRELGLL